MGEEYKMSVHQKIPVRVISASFKIFHLESINIARVDCTFLSNFYMLSKK